MKLEKKRASSMDKIMNKLRSAQKKAQGMRSSALADEAHQIAKTSHKAISFRRTGQMSSVLWSAESPDAEFDEFMKVTRIWARTNCKLNGSETSIARPVTAVVSCHAGHTVHRQTPLLSSR